MFSYNIHFLIWVPTVSIYVPDHVVCISGGNISMHVHLVLLERIISLLKSYPLSVMQTENIYGNSQCNTHGWIYWWPAVFLSDFFLSGLYSWQLLCYIVSQKGSLTFALMMVGLITFPSHLTFQHFTPLELI